MNRRPRRATRRHYESRFRTRSSSDDRLGSVARDEFGELARGFTLADCRAGQLLQFAIVERRRRTVLSSGSRLTARLRVATSRQALTHIGGIRRGLPQVVGQMPPAGPKPHPDAAAGGVWEFNDRATCLCHKESCSRVSSGPEPSSTCLEAVGQIVVCQHWRAIARNKTRVGFTKSSLLSPGAREIV